MSPHVPRAGQSLGSPSPTKMQPFSGGGRDHIVSRHHCANMVPDYFYLQRLHKNGILLSSKKSQEEAGGPGGGVQRRKRLPNKDQEG